MFAFDHDALVEALKRNWDKIAPPAMFTAAANLTTGNNENFLDALDTVRWNKKVTQDIANTYGGAGIGFQGTGALIPEKDIPGSNNKPVLSSDGYFVERFTDSDDKIIVPPGFEPIRGENIQYADTCPPLIIFILKLSCILIDNIRNGL